LSENRAQVGDKIVHLLISIWIWAKKRGRKQKGREREGENRKGEMAICTKYSGENFYWGPTTHSLQRTVEVLHGRYLRGDAMMGKGFGVTMSLS
jgi:hypothetical protein